MTTIWLDGKWLDRDTAKISVFDHGLLYGDGVFEGIRVYNGRVFRLERAHRPAFRFGAGHRSRHPDDPPGVGGPGRGSGQAFRAQRRLHPADRHSRRGRPRASIRSIAPSRRSSSSWTRSRSGPKTGTRTGWPASPRRHRSRIAKRSLPGSNRSTTCPMSWPRSKAAWPVRMRSLMLDAVGTCLRRLGPEHLYRQRAQHPHPAALRGHPHGRHAERHHGVRDAGRVRRERDALNRYDVYTADEAFLTGTASEVAPIRSLDGRADRDGQAGAGDPRSHDEVPRAGTRLSLKARSSRT